MPSLLEPQAAGALWDCWIKVAYTPASVSVTKDSTKLADA